MSTCSLKNAHPVTGMEHLPSLLNKELNEAFPDEITSLGGENGINRKYIELRENPQFLEWFGDWTNPDTHKEMREDIHSLGLFDAQGEPKLQTDISGNKYILNRNKSQMYLKQLFGKISSSEINEIVNSLSGEYLNYLRTAGHVVPNIKKYTMQKLEEAVPKLAAQIDDIMDDFDAGLIDDEGLVEATEEFRREISKIEILIKDKDLNAKLVSRMRGNLEKFNFKYSEETKVNEKYTDDMDDKEDAPDDHDDIANFLLSSTQTSNRTADDPRLLGFLASVPLFKNYDANDINLQQVERNPLLISPRYNDPSYIWGLIESTLVDVIPARHNTETTSKDLYQTYINELKLKAKATEHPELNYIADRLENIEDVYGPDYAPQFKINFVTAFFKSTQNYIITQVSTERDFTGSGKDVIRYKIIDPARVNSKEAKITNEYINTVLNSVKYKNSPGNLAAAKKGLKVELEEVERTGDVSDYQSLVHQILNDALDLNVSPEVIKYYVAMYQDHPTNNLQNQLHGFLTRDIHDTDVTDYTLGQDPSGEFDILTNILHHRGNPEAVEILKAKLLEQDTFLRNVAEADAVFRKDVSENTYYVGSSQQWAYSAVSGLQLQVNQWKSGDLTSLEHLSGKGFSIVDHIEEAVIKARSGGPGSSVMLDQLRIHTNSEIKTERDNQPVLHKKITVPDYHADSYAKMFASQDDFHKNVTDKLRKKGASTKKKVASLDNYFTYGFSADKNSSFALHGVPNILKGMDPYDYETQTIKEDFKNKLNSYVKYEMELAEKASLVIAGYFNKKTAEERHAYMMSNLIPGYHYKLTEKQEALTDESQIVLTAENFKDAEYHKLGLFSKPLENFIKAHKDHKALFMNLEEKRFIDVNLGTFTKGGNFKKLMDHVYTSIEKGINNNKKTLEKIVVINRELEDGSRQEMKLFDVDTNRIMGNSEQAMTKYIIGSFMINYEMSNIFNGHISFFKQKRKDGNIEITDFLKRAPAVAGDGKYPVHRNTGESKTYTDYNGVKHTIKEKDDHYVVAIASNMEGVVSDYDKIINEATGYKMNYEIADAQGYITPEHHKDLMTRIYGWTPLDTKMHEELMDPTHKVTKENIQWLKGTNKGATPKKFQYFDVIDKLHPESKNAAPLATPMPVYLKYSIAQLYPAIINGTAVQKLHDQMIEQGVDQVVFKSGSKASNPTSTFIHNMNEDGTYGGLKDAFKLNPFIINSSHLRQQSEIPTKMDKENKISMQAVKNILTNMNLDSDAAVYNFRGKDYTAKQMYDMTNRSGVNILDNQLQPVLKSLGYNAKDKTFNAQSVKRLLLNQMDVETELDLIAMMKSDLPFEAVPNFSQRAFPILSQYLQKQAGKIKTNAQSVVQVANIGFDQLTNRDKSGVYMFDKENTKLTPPIPETTPEGKIIYYNDAGESSTTKSKEFHRMRIKNARILVPFSSIFAETGLSYEEFIALHKAGGIDKKLLTTALGYRIPNQAISSNDSFDIAGILPPSAGDQAIVYHEITAKTGSDFDIDKMYMAMPNFIVKRKIGKKYLDVIKELKKLKPDFKHTGDFMQYKFRSGNHILTSLAKVPALEQYMLDNGVKFNYSKTEAEHPIVFIQEHFDQMMDIIEENTANGIEEPYIPTTDEHGDEWDITPTELIDDVLEAESKRREYIAEEWSEIAKTKEEKKARMREMEDYYSGEVMKLEYAMKGKKGEQNKFVELLTSILKSDTTYKDLIAPLDNDMIKDAINETRYLKTKSKEEREAYREKPSKAKAKIVKEYIESIQEDATEQMMPVSLTNARVDSLEAKTLVAIMANNMTDLGESQKVNFGIKYEMGLKVGDKIATTLDRVYQIGKENNEEFKLSKVVSYLMNASVDAAKDNYIIAGNFTSYSANAGMMLARLGLPVEDVFAILMNDTIMNFSKEKTYQRAKITDISSKYNQKKLDEFTKSLLSKLAKADNDLSNVISKDDFLDNPADKEEDILGFWNLIQSMGKEFNEAVVAMKSDSNGAGKNIPEFMANLNRIERVKKGATDNSFDKWFTNGAAEENMSFNPDIKSNENAKILGAMANNTLFLMEELSRNMFMETTDGVKAAVNKILSGLGRPLETDVNTIKLVYNYIYPYLLHQTGHDIYKIDERRKRYLLGTFPKHLLNYRKKLRAEGTPNEFLEQLNINTDKTKNLIEFPNYKSFTTKDKLRFKEFVNDMMQDTIKRPGLDKDYVGLGDALVQYSFLTTGFKSTRFSFNDMLPAGYFLNTMHGPAVQTFINKLNSKAGINFDYKEALTMMAKDHYKNFKIVKKLNSKHKLSSADFEDRIVYIAEDEKTLDRLSIGDGVYTPFFLKTSSKSERLYMRVGLTETTKKPIYLPITKHKEKEFNTYSYFNLEDKVNLYLDNIEYESHIKKLYKDSPSLSLENPDTNTVTECN